MSDKADERTSGELKEQIGEATGDEQLADEGKVERIADAVKDAGRHLREKVVGADEDHERRHG
jgi:uncharacterized protein YjbJ (UPF0337 family)